MVSGLEILGAVVAIEALAKDVATAVERFSHHREEVADLATRFADDANLLASLKESLQTQDRFLSNTDRAHLSRVFEHIDRVLKRTSETLHKMERRRLRAKLDWVISGTELEDHEVQLYRWTQRLGTRLIALPPHAKVVLAQSFYSLESRAGNELGRGLDDQNRMQHLAQAENPRTTTVLDVSSQIVLPADAEALRFESRLTGDDGALIVDMLRRPASGVAAGADPTWARVEVQRLSSVLAEVNPETMHIPKLKGFFESTLIDRPFGLVYTLPEQFRDRRTLSALLKTKGHSGKYLDALHPLEQRIGLARDIATAVTYVHSLGWVHKSIRSDNICISSTSADKRFPFGLGSGFLLGFEYARHSRASSTGYSPGDWRLEIYRHPERQVTGDEILPEAYYSQKHDVYSFGAVLLELGRWRSLEATPDIFTGKSPEERKANLIVMTSRIAPIIGSRFARLVKKCLEVDDEGPSMTDVLEELEDFKL